MIGRAVLRIERGDPGGHRLAFDALGQDHGPEIIVPDEGENQHAECGNRRFHQRQHDIPEDAPFRDALDTGGFDQLIRQRTDEITHEERAKPCLKSDMKQDQPGLGIIQPQLQRQIAHAGRTGYCKIEVLNPNGSAAYLSRVRKYQIRSKQMRH